MRRVLFVITAAAIVLTCSANATIYNLSDDWSDTNNPNGVWSLYKNATALFTINQSDFYNNGNCQKAWADQKCYLNAHVPVWLKSDDNGIIYVHGAEFDRTGSNITFARWTSPESGTVTIDGSVWTGSDINYRYMKWELRYQGAMITDGMLYADGNQRADNPVLFSAGSGGAGVLTFSVEAGQTIDLVFISASQGGNLGNFSGLDLTITTIPEPATMILLGLGGLLLRNRRNELSKM